MSSSWPKFVSDCKSRLSALARSCFLGRAQWREKFEEANCLLRELREACAQSEKRRQQLEQENLRLRERLGEREAQREPPQPAPLPLGEPPAGQQYGAGLMALCVNLARRLGLRPTVSALQIVFSWLGVDVQVPTYPAIRLWMQRLGLDRMQNAQRPAGGVWLADHTNQIGKEKVLVVMRVEESGLPRGGVPLRHQDVEVVALVPGETWKREDVQRVYQETAQRCGLPRALVCDGAVELREPAQTLGETLSPPLVLRDPKHFLANQLEALLKQDPHWEAFTHKLGGLRSALPQTELAHLLPPAFKAKARFMNLEPILTWAGAVLWHLDHPESASRQEVPESRMNEKLGWLRDFASRLRQWQAAQDVISATLAFLNRHGVFGGVVHEFQAQVAGLASGPMSQRLVEQTLDFLRGYEGALRPGERLPLSTEIVESSFSRYKQLEQQHSKSGFTSLLLTFPTLLRPTTPQEVAAAFARVKVAAVKQWIQEHLPQSLAAKRRRVFREPRGKPQKRATPKTSAA